MNTNIQKIILGSMLSIPALFTSINALADKTESKAIDGTTISNQTAGHKVRIKEGLFFRTNKTLLPNEKISISPIIDYINFSVEYFDTENNRFTAIPNCTLDLNHGDAFDVVVQDNGDQPMCDINITIKRSMTRDEEAYIALEASIHGAHAKL